MAHSIDWRLVSLARDFTDRMDTIRLALMYDLCADCRMDRGDRHHSPGYRMDRSPYDIPGHAFLSMADALASLKAAGGAAAVLSAVSA